MNPLFYYEDFEYMYITTGRGGGGKLCELLGKGCEGRTPERFSYTRLPGHVQLQQTLFTIHAIFADGIKPCRTWFLRGKTCDKGCLPSTRPNRSVHGLGE